MTMPYTTSKTDAYHKHAEVFTPPWIVFFMVLQGGIREIVKDVDKTLFDPCCGHGQFPCAELVCKMFYNVDTLDEETAVRALASLYGADIQAASVDKTRDHLKATIADAYEFFTGKKFSVPDDVLDKIIDRNFLVGDSLKIMKQWTTPQQSLF